MQNATDSEKAEDPSNRDPGTALPKGSPSSLPSGISLRVFTMLEIEVQLCYGSRNGPRGSLSSSRSGAFSLHRYQFQEPCWYPSSVDKEKKRDYSRIRRQPHQGSSVDSDWEVAPHTSQTRKENSKYREGRKVCSKLRFIRPRLTGAEVEGDGRTCGWSNHLSRQTLTEWRPSVNTLV